MAKAQIALSGRTGATVAKKKTTPSSSAKPAKGKGGASARPSSATKTTKKAGTKKSPTKKTTKKVITASNSKKTTKKSTKKAASKPAKKVAKTTKKTSKTTKKAGAPKSAPAKAPAKKSTKKPASKKIEAKRAGSEKPAPKKPEQKKPTKKPAKNAASEAPPPATPAASPPPAAAKAAAPASGAKPEENKRPVSNRPKRVKPPAAVMPEGIGGLLSPGGPAPKPLIASTDRVDPAEAAQAEKYPTKSPFNKRELEKFRTTLLAKRAQVLNEVAGLEGDALTSGGSGNLSHTPQHMADAGSDAADQTISLDLAAAERNLIREIDAALQRIRDGVFGLCLATGKPIRKERLAELPWARYSIDAARQLEGKR